MEALVFALIAVGNGYHQQETIVPEPTEFQPFDLRATLRAGRLIGRKRSWPRSHPNRVDP